jgi:hypothetical protein
MLYPVLEYPSLGLVGQAAECRPSRCFDEAKQSSMALRPKKVAWSPPNISAETALVAVMVPPGALTGGQWWEALADRITDMAVQEDDPGVVVWACKVLGDHVGMTDDPREAGQFLVSGNLNLRTHLTLAMRDEVFPAMVEHSSQHALDAIDECDFALWVELAAAQVGA